MKSFRQRTATVAGLLMYLCWLPALPADGVAERFSTTADVQFDSELDEDFDIDALRTEAAAGDPAAQNLLGVLYFQGEVVERDYARALEWFGRAAEQEHAVSRFNLGIMHLTGRGVPQNYEEAKDAFELAAEDGIADAQYNLGIMYLEGLGAERDDETAVSLFRRAAEQGHPGAQVNLGNMYVSGRGVTQDFYVAADWYRRAAEQGHPYAQSSLGQMLLSGEQVPQDLDSAALWLGQAAEQGVPEAQYHFGMMHLMGHGLTQDPDVAAGWIEKSAEQGFAEAQYNLGLMFANGIGMPMDFVLAYQWIILADARGYVGAEQVSEILSQRMTRDQVREAELLARDWTERKEREAGDHAAPDGASDPIDEIESLVGATLQDAAGRLSVSRSSFLEWIDTYDLGHATDRVMEELESGAEFEEYRRTRTDEPPLIVLLEYALEKEEVESEIKAWLRFLRPFLLSGPQSWGEAREAYEELAAHRPEDLPPKAAMLLLSRSEAAKPRTEEDWIQWAEVLQEAIPLAQSSVERRDFLVLALLAVNNHEFEKDGAAIQAMWEAVENVDAGSLADSSDEPADGVLALLLIAMTTGNPLAAAEIADDAGMVTWTPLFLMLGDRKQEAADRLFALRFDRSLTSGQQDFLWFVTPLILIFTHHLGDADEFIRNEETRPGLNARQRSWLEQMRDMLDSYEQRESGL